MSLDAMKQALEALEHVHRTGDTQVFDLCYADKVIPALRAAIEQARQWQGLTDEEIKAPIQRAMQYFGFDPTQYSLGGAATIGFLGLVREIEAKLKEKNHG